MGNSIQRLAYVSDTTAHCIRVYDLDSQMELNLAAGLSSNAGTASIEPVTTSAARFRGPKGIAFLENNMGSNQRLLIADSGNSVIRMLDIAHSEVSIWYAAKDKQSPEMVHPHSIAVAINSDGDTIVYVIDTGFGVQSRLSALSMPTGSSSLIILTVLNTGGVTKIGPMLVPGPNLLRIQRPGSGLPGTGVKDLVYADTDGNLHCMLENSLASESMDATGATCVYPSHAVNATLESLCGNMYLDVGEQCDTGNIAGTGCVPLNCTIEPTNWACAGSASKCLSPCPAFLHAVSIT